MYLKDLEDKIQPIDDRKVSKSYDFGFLSLKIKVTLNYFCMDDSILLLHFPKPDFMRK